MFVGSEWLQSLELWYKVRSDYTCSLVSRAIRPFCKLSGLNRSLLSCGSGGQKSEMKVWAGQTPWEGTREGSSPALSPRFWSSLGSGRTTRLHVAFPVCTSVSTCPHLIRIPGMLGWGPPYAGMTSSQLSYICSDAVSYILGY